MDASPRSLVAVFFGAGTGAVARYLITLATQRWWGDGFPYGTLAVNALGGLCVGLLAPLLAQGSPGRVWLIVGLLGGFTTFSAYSAEVIHMLRQGHWQSALLYIFASHVLALGLCGLGHWAASAAWVRAQ